MSSDMSSNGDNQNVKVSGEESESQIQSQSQSVQSLAALLFGSPVNAVLTLVIAFLVYKLVRGRVARRNTNQSEAETFKVPEPLPKHDMTLQELRQYDGKGTDQRICIAILGKVYDCSKGHRFYGPTGPYAPLAGHDATRALAHFDVEAVKEEWDDVSDLTPYQMSSVNEWMEQFSERYDLVGKLVREGQDSNDHIGADDDPDADAEAEEGDGEGETEQREEREERDEGERSSRPSRESQE